MVDLNIQLPESFFQEEERSGYLVSAKTKELWAVQLDLLNELDRVCKKYNLKYFLDFGSMLGAVRHKGFVPWDEDIDVSMLRDDYDKLLEIGPKEFKYPYFFQSFKTELDYDISVTRLRRSDTTFLQSEDIINHNKYNLGIFIDIFVFDDVPSNNLNEISRIHGQVMKYYSAALTIAQRRRKYSNHMLTVIMFFRYLAYKWRYGSSAKAFAQMDSISKQYKNKDFVSCVFTNIGIRCRRKAWLNEIIYMPFETMLMPVPAAYDEVLKECYGDYREPVIDSSLKVWFFDASHPYNDFITRENFHDNLMKELSITSKDYEISVTEYLALLKKKFLRIFSSLF